MRDPVRRNCSARREDAEPRRRPSGNGGARSRRSARTSGQQAPGSRTPGQRRSPCSGASRTRARTPTSLGVRHCQQSNLDELDRKFATELVYGTTRMRRACDSLVDRFVASPPDAVMRTVLRLGAYQLAYAGVPPHAAVGETVGVGAQTHPRSRQRRAAQGSRLSIADRSGPTDARSIELPGLDRRACSGPSSATSGSRPWPG